MKVIEINLTEEDLKKMSTDDFVELLKKAGVEIKEEDKLQRDVESLKSKSTMIYSLYSAMERVNIFMNHGHLLHEVLEVENDDTIVYVTKIINECIRQHAEEFDYDYVLELKRR